MNKKCCFAGHRELYNRDEIYNKVLECIESLIVNENVLEFWVGNYGQFDGLCANAVRKLKEKYADIELNLVIPYVTKEINEYKDLYYKKYDNILMADIPLNTPKRFHISKCNEYMVQSSDFIICYVQYGWGGSRKTLEFAKRKNIKIFNLAEK